MSETWGELNNHQLIYGIQMYPLEFMLYLIDIIVDGLITRFIFMVINVSNHIWFS